MLHWTRLSRVFPYFDDPLLEDPAMHAVLLSPLLRSAANGPFLPHTEQCCVRPPHQSSGSASRTSRAPSDFSSL
jgi:hypothetical protein